MSRLVFYISLVIILEYLRIVRRAVVSAEGFDGRGNVCIMIHSGDAPPPLIKSLKSASQSSPNFYLLGSVRSI